jgi:hypothetical protein
MIATRAEPGPVDPGAVAPVPWYDCLNLASDLRFRLFTALLALSLIHHELQFILEQQRFGPFLHFLDNLRPFRATIDWPSQAGVGLHLLSLLAGVVLLLRPERWLLGLLGLLYPITQVVSPDRIASHNVLLAAAAILVLLLGLGEAIEVAVRPAARAAARVGWLRWTRVGLIGLCSVTYFFAGIAKFNTDWLSPVDTSVLGFVLAPISLFRLPVEPALGLMLYPAIYGTIAVELGLAFFLPWRRTTLVAILAGLLFHLPMLAQGVGDFPTLILAFYPLCLSERQARELLARCRARPARPQLAATLGLAAFGIALIHRSPQPRFLYTTSLEPTPLLNVIHMLLLDLTFLLFAHVTVVVAAWLVERCRRALSGRGLLAPQPL